MVIMVPALTFTTPAESAGVGNHAVTTRAESAGLGDELYGYGCRLHHPQLWRRPPAASATVELAPPAPAPLLWNP